MPDQPREPSEEEIAAVHLQWDQTRAGAYYATREIRALFAPVLAGLREERDALKAEAGYYDAADAMQALKEQNDALTRRLAEVEGERERLREAARCSVVYAGHPTGTTCRSLGRHAHYNACFGCQLRHLLDGAALAPQPEGERGEGTCS